MVVIAKWKTLYDRNELLRIYVITYNGNEIYFSNKTQPKPLRIRRLQLKEEDSLVVRSCGTASPTKFLRRTERYESPPL